MKCWEGSNWFIYLGVVVGRGSIWCVVCFWNGVFVSVVGLIEIVFGFVYLFCVDRIFF